MRKAFFIEASGRFKKNEASPLPVLLNEVSFVHRSLERALGFKRGQEAFSRWEFLTFAHREAQEINEREKDHLRAIKMVKIKVRTENRGNCKRNEDIAFHSSITSVVFNRK